MELSQTSRTMKQANPVLIAIVDDEEAVCKPLRRLIRDAGSAPGGAERPRTAPADSGRLATRAWLPPPQLLDNMAPRFRPRPAA
ncbi:protein of unknown function [Methylococcus capsulatus]|uniref:Uncharacterized protein n=1 Tax=Methylococcus capsulatus TaxID=414 RepID=A0AA35ULT1_METCP|nr:protein of unknown function [Methylococcus capsulatus]